MDHVGREPKTLRCGRDRCTTSSCNRAAETERSCLSAASVTIFGWCLSSAASLHLTRSVRPQRRHVAHFAGCRLRSFRRLDRTAGQLCRFQWPDPLLCHSVASIDPLRSCHCPRRSAIHAVGGNRRAILRSITAAMRRTLARFAHHRFSCRNAASTAASAPSGE